MTSRSAISGAAVLLGAAIACAACGGGNKGEATTPDESSGGSEGGEGGGGGEASGGGDSGMVAPDIMDEIQRRFDRKRPAVSRCLSAAIDAKELPKNSRGRITLNVTVMPGGQAGEIKVANATLESQRLTDCVIGKVKEIGFPEVPQPFPTSYTYAFEAM